MTVPQEYPLVSVLVPVRNESTHIACCLEAITGQEYPRDRLETIVVDGLSSDGTRNTIAEFITRQPNVRLLDNPARIVPAALNIGLAAARGDIILRVDGHTIIAPDYVRECVDALHKSDADNVGGRMFAIGSSGFGRAVALATSSPFGVGAARFHYSQDEEWVDTVYLGAWPRGVFGQIGLFDEELVRDQDDEFNYRLREAGGRVLLSPRIRSHYTVRGSALALWRQYFEYGYWKVRVLQKHPRQMQWHQFVPPLFVTALMASGALWIAHPFASIPLVVVAGSYLLANVVASALVAAKRDRKSILVLPVIFAILHFGYGLGFLVGLIRFAGRWADRLGRVPPPPQPRCSS